MPKTSGLTVRQHERAGLELPVEFEISDAHAPQVQFSAASSAPGPRTVRGRAIDISPGGVGLETSQFVPRMTEGIVRVFMGARSSGGTRCPAFEQPVKVRRVTQLSRGPAYSLGLAFVDAPADIEKLINQLIDSSGTRPEERHAAGGDHA